MKNKAPRFVVRRITPDFTDILSEPQHEDIAMYPTIKMATDRIIALQPTCTGGVHYIVRNEVAIAAGIVYFVENGHTEYVTGPYTQRQAEDIVKGLIEEGMDAVGVTKPEEYDYMANRVQSRAAYFAAQAILNPVFL